MTDPTTSIDRRTVLGGLGAAFVGSTTPSWAQARTTLSLEALAGTIALKPGQAPASVWHLAGGPDTGPLRFKKGDVVDVTLTNRLPVPIALNWIGLDGNPSAEPMTGRPWLAPGASATYPVIFRHAGTMLLNLIGVTDAALPSVPRAVLVIEPDAAEIDRDVVFVLQGWRVKPDGSAVAPGRDPGGAATIFTVNGKPNLDLTSSQNERLRFRFSNTSQVDVIAIKMSDYNVHVLAIDGQPSEPFLARDGMIVLTPGSRVDAIVDTTKAAGATSAITLLDGREARPIGKIIVSDAQPARSAPLPLPGPLLSNGLPAKLDLKAALRIDLPLGTADWLAPAALTSGTLPAFKVKRGRVVVLALANRGPRPIAFHLHGHHVRLLDRLDDGWKPFWLDTLLVAPGQIQRIAFAAEFPGLYPMQATVTDWGKPQTVRSYLVE